VLARKLLSTVLLPHLAI